MNPVSANSEVWIIQDGQAILLCKRENIWQQELSTPFEEFLGSATALSSFTLPETSVFLSLDSIDRPEMNGLGRCWVGIEQDPPRLRQVACKPLHLEQITQIQAMGKSAQAIFTSKPENFERATVLKLLEPVEHQHISQWLKTRKSGESASWCNVRLGTALWVKTERSYLHLRMVAITCTALALLAMNVHAQQQLRQQALQTRQLIASEHSKQVAKTDSISLSPWATQINKFGQGNRANLQALHIHWNSNGEVYSFAQLDRDRKRAPKGCKLLSAIQAECTSEAQKQ